jgi:peptidoglycan/xylan/chitin deacetylase (PgdA/CDA1 family)/glycosyltransferase involved in cell wall biosynthesis
VSNRVATVIRCADRVQHVYETLASVEAQEGIDAEKILITDDSTPVLARDWVSQVAGRRGMQAHHAYSSKPGAIRNLGLRMTDAPYVVCLDAGDRLDPRFYRLACAKLDEDPDVDLITSFIQILGPGARRAILKPDGHDLRALIGSPETIHSASMFRRHAWVILGEFDETLTSLEDYDFFLRMLKNGGRAALIEYPLLIRVMREDALYRRVRTQEVHVESMTRIIEKHVDVFGFHVADALYARESLLSTLARTYRQALSRWEDDWARLESLKERAADLRRSTDANGHVDFGDFRRTAPFSRNWGYERGTPVDRPYIEQFLERHAVDIRGRVLEVKDAEYTNRFGGAQVTRSDIVDIDPANTRANVISDLRRAANIASDTYDCVILTQTLHFIDDVQAAISECARILRPGGVLLATLPCVSRVYLEDGQGEDFWRVTEGGAMKMFSSVFSSKEVEVRAYGNVLASLAFLYGLGAEELTDSELSAADPYFPVVVGVRARKEPNESVNPSERSYRLASPSRIRGDGTAPAILLYHRVSTLTTDVHALSQEASSFRAQMAYLRERYRPMPLEELLSFAQRDHIPARAVAVTFDDGYVDNYSTASSILMEFHLPATFFVTTEKLSDHYEFWWDVLERILLSPAATLPARLQVELPHGRRTFGAETFEQRMIAHTEIYRAIVASPAAVRDEVLGSLLRLTGRTTVVESTSRRMNSIEIAELAQRAGHTIGAHSSRHLMLPDQPPEVQREEIEKSRQTLERLLNHPVRAFSYPFGRFNDVTVDAVRAAGFEMAVSGADTTVPPAVDLLRVPRLVVTPQRAAKFDRWLDRQVAQQDRLA